MNRWYTPLGGTIRLVDLLADGVYRLKTCAGNELVFTKLAGEWFYGMSPVASAKADDVEMGYIVAATCLVPTTQGESP